MSAHKTTAQRRADRRGRKTGKRARAHQTAICIKLGVKTPAQRHYELPRSIPAPVRDIMQSWINRDEQRHG